MTYPHDLTKTSDFENIPEAPDRCFPRKRRTPAVGRGEGTWKVRSPSLRLRRPATSEHTFQLCLPSRLHGFLGRLALLHVPPECNQQLSGQGHSTGPFHAGGAAAEPSLVPLTQRALGLEVQPAPRQLRHDPADPDVAGLADALFVVALAALVGRRR